MRLIPMSIRSAPTASLSARSSPTPFLHALRCGFVLALGWSLAGPATAQIPEDATGSAQSLGMPGGFAPTLQGVPSREAAAGQPYRPIQKPDDQAQVPEIEMFVGESRVFPSPGVARIAVGNGRVLTAAALDERDSYTDQHCDRVSLLAHGLGERCGLSGAHDHHIAQIRHRHGPG